MNTNIPLSGVQFDLGRSMRDGLGLAAGQKAFDQQNALAELYKTQGANIMAGDQNALNALAQFDPTAALGIQSQHQQNAYATEDQQRQRETARREGERYAKEVGAEQAAAEAAELEAAVKQALAAPSPEAFDAMMTQMGRPEMVGQFENREMLAIPFLGMAEGMKLAAGPDPVDPTKGAPNGYFYTDPSNPAAGVKPLPGYVAKSAVEINMGEDAGRYLYGTDAGVPAGWRVDRETGVASPIPGGPEDTSKSSAAAAEGSLQQSNVVLGKIKQAQDIITGSAWYNPATGFGAQTAATVGGSNAANYKAVTDTIEANIAFDALSAMRAASPTGGALGAISERELNLLGATLASLSQTQDPEQAAKHLAELEAVYKQIMAKAAAYPNASEFGFGGAGTPTPDGGTATEMSDEDFLKSLGIE